MKNFDEQVEKAVLGSILQNNQVLVDLAFHLEKKAFYLNKHQYIYQIMLEIFQDSGPIDEIIVAEKLDQKGLLNECGGYSYIIELLDSATATENILYHSKVINNFHSVRKLLAVSSKIKEELKKTDNDFSQVLVSTQQQLDQIADKKVAKSYIEIGDIVDDTVNKLKTLSKNGDEITGVKTGFTFLDKITSGLQKSDLIVIAARPSMGKTALSLNIAQYVAIKQKKPVIFFNLEMSDEQICLRVISGEAGINGQNLKTGNLTEENWLDLTRKIDEIKQAPLYLCSKAFLTTFDFQVICKQISRILKDELALIVVDYLQLMKSANKHFNRQEEITEISRTLKMVAKEFNIPVIANAQLNRDLEKRKDKIPILSDLRESGSIEQDADIILFIYRDYVYNKETEYPDISDIVVGKFRNGATGTYKLHFNGELTKFSSLSPKDEEDIKSSTSYYEDL